MGEVGVQVDIGWKTSHATQEGLLVALEEWDYEDAIGDPQDSSLMQGVVLANQIIQRHSGNFRLRLRNGVVLGFQFQLPLNLPHALSAYHLSPVSSLPGARSHLHVDTKDLLS